MTTPPSDIGPQPTELPPRTEMTCRVCGGFSSAQVCWHCSPKPEVARVLSLERELAELRKKLEEERADFLNCCQTIPMMGDEQPPRLWNAVRLNRLYDKLAPSP